VRALAGENRAGEQLVVTANMRMTPERLAGFTKAVHEAVLSYGTDALSDELLTPADRLMPVGAVITIAPLALATFHAIPRISSAETAVISPCDRI
jgi:hypothetical protein